MLRLIFVNKVANIHKTCRVNALAYFVKSQWRRTAVLWSQLLKRLFLRDKLERLSCFVPPGNSYWRGRLSAVDLLIKITCFAKHINNMFIIKRSWSKLVNTRRSTVVLIHPLQLDFPGSAVDDEDELCDRHRAGFSWRRRPTAIRVSSENAISWKCFAQLCPFRPLWCRRLRSSGSNDVKLFSSVIYDCL